jgi:hypothetical protein
MKKIVIFVMTLLTISACDSNQNRKMVVREANGRINEIIIVIKNSEWDGEIGDELRKVIAEPIVGLPQPEAQFRVTNVPPNNFGKLFNSIRSILKVGIGSENGMSVHSDVFAKPQKIVTITGKSKEELINEIRKRSKEFIAVFKDADIKTVQLKETKDHWDPSQIETFKQQGFTLRIPSTYRPVDDTGDFLWYRFHLSSGHSMELIAYTIPNLTVEDEQGATIIANRDAIGERYMPGGSEGTHMITEKAYIPHTSEVELNGRKAFETRGKWEVKGDFMAGPFISYSVVDKKNNRLVVVEGMTYAPGLNKRDYMFELEAVIKTLKIE